MSEALTYCYIRQNVMLNEFIRLGPVTLNTLTPVHGKAVIKSGALSVEITGYSTLISADANTGLKTSTYRLLDAILLWFTEHNCDANILLNLKDYMSLCRNTDEKETRRKINNDLRILCFLTISYDDNRKKHGTKYSNIKLFDSATIKNSIITVVLNQQFADIISGSYPMPFPLPLFTIKTDKYPNTYYMLRKIAEHKNMNFGKPNENTISAKTLLHSAPGLPSAEDVRTSQT